MTEVQKKTVDRAVKYAPLMSFFSITVFGVSGAFYLGSFMSNYKQTSLTPLEKETILDHVAKSDDVKAYKALDEYNEATEAFMAKSDTLAKNIQQTDSLARLNFTTIYQIKEGQAKFFSEILREIKRSQ